MNVITIDGKEYNVGVVSLKRGAAVLDGKNAGRVLTGRMVRDIIGTYYNYDLTFGRSLLSPTDYDALYEVLTAPQKCHIITVPYGQGTKTFEAYVSNASDALLRMTDTMNLWGDLTIKFTAMEPMRRPQ